MPSIVSIMRCAANWFTPNELMNIGHFVFVCRAIASANLRFSEWAIDNDNGQLIRWQRSRIQWWNVRRNFQQVRSRYPMIREILLIASIGETAAGSYVIRSVNIYIRVSIFCTYHTNRYNLTINHRDIWRLFMCESIDSKIVNQRRKRE